MTLRRNFSYDIRCPECGSWASTRRTRRRRPRPWVLEAGLVVLPINYDGLTVTLLMRDEVDYASRSSDHGRALTTMEPLKDSRLVL